MTRSSDTLKIIFTSLILTIGVGVIAFIFWRQEIKYTLPTEVPGDYAAIAPGESVSLPASLQKDKAYFFHFYNPDCPCSRFNARHIQSLIRSYNDSIRFVIVIADHDALANAKTEFGDDLDFIEDTDHAIAKSCGVYSTPQAAIISDDGKLYYRGNYNSTRYCTKRASNFAELSLIALLNQEPAPAFGIAATQSYGCELNNATTDIELF